KETVPPPATTIGYDMNEFEAWRSAVESLEAKTLYANFKEDSLKNYRGQLRIQNQNNETIELSLFGEYGPLKGDFVISSRNSYLYDLDHNHAGIFFQNVQDFWNLIPLGEEEGELSLSLSNGKERFDLILIPGNVFNVRVKNSEKEP